VICSNFASVLWNLQDTAISVSTQLKPIQLRNPISYMMLENNNSWDRLWKLTGIYIASWWTDRYPTEV